jgi:hypothetical protein
MQSHHSSSTIINTQEYMAASFEQFCEHVDFCGEPFKEEIMKKVQELKRKDHKCLTTFVSLLLHLTLFVG